MKKMIMGAVLALGLAFSAAAETWIDFGFNAFNLWENTQLSGTKTSLYMFEPGLYFNLKIFDQKKPVGFWMHVDTVFPDAFRVTQGNIVVDGKYSETYNAQRVNYGFSLGPILRIGATQKISAYIGFGFAMNFLDLKSYQKVGSNEYSTEFFALCLGLGADFGVKINVLSHLYINAGLGANWFWSTWTNKTAYINSSKNASVSGWSQNPYSMFVLKPYAGIGFNF